MVLKDSKGATDGTADAASGDEARHETSMIELTDELLVAFVDGELPEEIHARVQAQIAKDPVAQQKVKDLEDTAALLRAAFGEGEPKDVTVLLKPRGPRMRLKSRPVLSSLAAAAAFGLMFGNGRLMHPFGTD
jgi:anti-sigma factor RsiW